MTDVMWDLGVKGQERILETFPVQKGVFIKAWERDPWAGRALRGFRGVTDYVLFS